MIDFCSVLIVGGFAVVHADKAIPIRKQSLLGEVVADGSIHMSSSLTDWTPELSTSLVRKATEGQVSADGSIEIYNGLDDECIDNEAPITGWANPTCALQKEAGECDEDWNIGPDGYCRMTCGHCTSAVLPSPAPLATSFAPGGLCAQADNTNCAGFHDAQSNPCECPDGSFKADGECADECVPVHEQTNPCSACYNDRHDGVCFPNPDFDGNCTNPSGSHVCRNGGPVGLAPVTGCDSCYVHIHQHNIATPTADVGFNSAAGIPPWNDNTCYLNTWQRWCDHELNDGCSACEKEIGAVRYCLNHCIARGCLLRMSKTLQGSSSMSNGRRNLRTFPKQSVGTTICKFCQDGWCPNTNCTNNFATCLATSFWPSGNMDEPLMSGDRRRDADRGLGYQFDSNDRFCFAADWNYHDGDIVLEFGPRMTSTQAYIETASVCACLQSYLQSCSGAGCIESEICNCPGLCNGFKQDWGCSGRSLAQTHARIAPKTSSRLGSSVRPSKNKLVALLKKRRHLGQQLHARTHVTEYHVDESLDESVIRKNGCR